jgi:transposase
LQEFLETDKERQAGNTARQATSNEVKVLRGEARDLKEVSAERMLENRVLKNV